MFITDDLSFKVRNDLVVDDVGIAECLLIELVLDSFIIACIYRPPNADMVSFTALMCTLLSKVNNEKKIICCR